MIPTTAIRTFLMLSLLISPQVYADITDILVYKGELRFVMPVDEARDSMLIQYRSKSRKVLRIAIQGLTVTNMDTYRYFRLPDRSVKMMNDVDGDGYWTTDILYNSLNLANESHRVEGHLIQYLAGSQRTRRFSVYLRPETVWEPSHSSIDWGLDD
ncbi:MAG: hypothetical protein JSW45_11510 [Thiotrichales bacterium]|nr:MAG: hypothetical protein JSW45_11510 [Thiotrichales bacterium]